MSNKKINTYKPSPNLFTDTFIIENLSHLEGKLLTFLEAILDDSTKLEASKSMVRELISNKIDWVLKVSHQDPITIDPDKLSGIPTVIARKS